MKKDHFMYFVVCLTIAFLLFSGQQWAFSQVLFETEGNGLFEHGEATRLTIRSSAFDANALLRLGNGGTSKVSLGYEANDEIFKIASGSTLSENSLTMGIDNFTNHFGINSRPTTHRLQIEHNSTSGVNGSSHLHLLESSTTDFARLRFGNDGASGLWTFAARATDGDALLNFFYNDGANSANLMSLDGDGFRVGIHQTEPNAYLHIKQQYDGIDALKLENDESTGGDIWGLRIGDNDILIYYEGELRASINDVDGGYTNFPPSSVQTARSAPQKNEKVLDQLLQIKPSIYQNTDQGKKEMRLDPYQINEINSDWVVASEDGTKLGINYEQMLSLLIASIKEQQDALDQQNQTVDRLVKSNNILQKKIAVLEQKQKKVH